MKKFLSLMLAVLLLVSAIPFQAFAAETTTIYIEVKDENGKIGNTQAITDAVVGASYDADELLAMANAKSGGAYADYEAVSGSIDSVTPNKGVVVMVKEKEEPTQPSTEATEPSTEATEPSTEATEPEAPKPTAAVLYIELKTAAGNKVGSTLEYGEVAIGTSYNAAQLLAMANAKTGNAYADYKAVSGNITISAVGTNGVVVVVEKIEAPTTQPTQPTQPSEPEDVTHERLTFKYRTGPGKNDWTSTTVIVKVGEKINAPEIPSVSGLKHTGWNNNLYDGWTRYYIGMPTEYTAVYVESTDDDLVDLTVYAYYYVDGEYHHKAKLFVEEFKESKTNNMVPWIYSEGIARVKTELAEEYGADGYQWNPTVFYNCYDDGEISVWGDLYATGNRDLYVKVNSKKAIEATVLLHIHTAKEYAIARTVKMPGYTAGDFVSYNEALAKVKNYYTGSKMEMSDLYDEGDWEDLMDGYKPSGSKTVKVEHNGTTEIHVILSNATSKTGTSNADPSNPKTGDYITIAVGTMVMAAAALVTLAELKKRKMI